MELHYPDISVVILTHNHEDFIAQCIESVLMQQYEGNIQLVISNDASTDSTDKTIKNCLNNSLIPQNISIEYTCHTENKGMMLNFAWTLKQAKGKYIAFLDGDDYWLDPLKLIKQAKILEEHPGYAFVFSDTALLSAEGCTQEDLELNRVHETRLYTPQEIFEKWIVPFNTVLFRNVLDERFYRLILENKNFVYGDIVLFLFLAEKGRIFGVNETTAMYRRHSGNVTSKTEATRDYLRKIKHFQEIIKVFGKKYRTPLVRSYLRKYSRNLLKSSYSDGRYLQAVKYWVKFLWYSF